MLSDAKLQLRQLMADASPYRSPRRWTSDLEVIMADGTNNAIV